MSEFIIVETTFEKEAQAQKMAENLVKNRLAACVQISKIDSFYNWQGEFCRNEEFSLKIKSKNSLFDKIEALILKNHEYDNPQITCLEIDKISDNYKKWLTSSIIS